MNGEVMVPRVLRGSGELASDGHGSSAVKAAASAQGRAARPSEDAIHRLVDRFYARVRRDPVLGPVFTRAIGESEEAWSKHLARLTDFWSSLMLASGRYHGDPFSAHLRLPNLEPAMFDRWLTLFGDTCAELFEPEVADAFRERAARVARSLRMGLFERLPTRRRA
ncbi:MAG TPA: group III truncated hemoglobin [Roseomonas sp.]|nr:group III truncated hemoglobin [Roseomonas sp.]